MKLNMLIGSYKGIRSIKGDMETDINDITSDSRLVSGGALFAAMHGTKADGNAYIESALRNGASAIIYEEGSTTAHAADGNAVCIGVGDVRDAYAYMSSSFYGNPSGTLYLAGITGTNGKTTISYIMKSILDHAGFKTGLIGTIKYIIGNDDIDATHTTPDAKQLQGMLRRMSDIGCTHAIMEASSHGLSQKRLNYCGFDTAVFTNLTRDHLDYHLDMEDYFRSKCVLFTDLLKGTAVINADDPYGARLMDMLDAPKISYGLNEGADLRAYGIKLGGDGMSFSVGISGTERVVESKLVGMPNVYNILASIGACLNLGLTADAIASGIRELNGVEGRFQKVQCGQDFLCIVDFAHTEDALRRLIQSVREFADGRVITVFGCGGERDRGKRPAMGNAATSLSDLTVITSDNPRGEEPDGIIKDILSGVSGKDYEVIPDRKDAINFALNEAKKGDAVILAGKGHEKYQEIAGIRHPFGDMDTACEAIKRMLAKAG